MLAATRICSEIWEQVVVKPTHHFVHTLTTPTHWRKKNEYSQYTQRVVELMESIILKTHITLDAIHGYLAEDNV